MQKVSSIVPGRSLDIVETISAVSERRLPLQALATVWLSTGGSGQCLMDELNSLVSTGTVEMDGDDNDLAVALPEGHKASALPLSSGELAAIASAVSQARRVSDHVYHLAA